MPITKRLDTPKDARYLHFTDFIWLNAETAEGGITCIYNGYAKPYPLPTRSIKRMTSLGSLTQVYIECCLGQDMGTYTINAEMSEIIEVLEREGLPIPETVSQNEMPDLKIS